MHRFSPSLNEAKGFLMSHLISISKRFTNIFLNARIKSLKKNTFFVNRHCAWRLAHLTKISGHLH